MKRCWKSARKLRLQQGVASGRFVFCVPGAGRGRMIAIHSFLYRFLGSEGISMSKQHAKAARPHWEILATLVAAEEDPDRVLALSKELVKALDEDSRHRLERVTSESKKKPMTEENSAPPTVRENHRVR